MELTGLKIGLGITGSHCTLKKVFKAAEELKAAGAEIQPIFSPAVAKTKTRFGAPADWVEKMEQLTDNPIWYNIEEVEPVGPKQLLDIMVVAPCSGNTLAKMVGGITDTAVLMAVKAQLRNNRPVVLGVSTNDGLGANGKNIGMLLNSKNIYWVPFGQDDPAKKQQSLVANMDLLTKTVILARKHQQIQPILIEYSK